MKSLSLAAILIAALSAISASAADAPKPENLNDTMVPSKEHREKLAEAHEKMAACLRTDQSFQSCHEELRKQCQTTMGESCPGMGMGKGMRRGTGRK